MGRPKPHALREPPKTMERDIERACTLMWDRLMLMTKKNNGPGNKHWPDRVFINSDGLHLYVEFKAPGKLPTPGQARMMNRLRNMGCHVYMIDNKKDGATLLTLFANSEAYMESINIGIDIFNAERAAKH